MSWKLWLRSSLVGKAQDYTRVSYGRSGLSSAQMRTTPFSPKILPFSISPPIHCPGKDVAEVEKAFDQEVEKLQKEPVAEMELEKAKNQLEASFTFSQDSLFYQAMLLAQHEISFSWKVIDEYLPSIRKVSPEDIQRVAKHYLIPDNRTVGILIPLPPQRREANSCRTFW